jgi:hypothetical protein
MRERIHDVRGHAEKTQLEYLEQAARACANDHDFGFDGAGGGGKGLAQGWLTLSERARIIVRRAHAS